MSRASFAYRPALDGLRACAVLAVIAYHLGAPWMPGGFLGVDAFFVVSGYLITSLLLHERAVHGRVSLRAFWLRRARRLLPAVLVSLIAVLAAVLVWSSPTQRNTLRVDAMAALAYVANWRFVTSGQSYFDLYSTPSPLRHMWSLAIEEQFYLVWPVVLCVALWLPRRFGKFLGVMLGAAIVASAFAMAVSARGADVSRAYYGTDTRVHVILSSGCSLRSF
jgi:peptidoglycan/LPS O-acetylase OafA/YrhL